MSNVTSPSDFNVNIMVQAAGPIRPRTKYKEHKLLRAEGSIIEIAVAESARPAENRRPTKANDPFGLRFWKGD